MKTITTPKNKIKIEIKEDITGLEWEEIQKPITDFDFEFKEGGKTSATFNSGISKRESVDKATEIVVQSVGGEKDNILDRVKGLCVRDYRFLLKEIDDIVSSSDADFLEEEKKESSGTESDE